MSSKISGHGRIDTPRAEPGLRSLPVWTQVVGEVSTWLSTRCEGKDLPSAKKLAAVMAARSRPRGGMTKEDPPDAHEERNLWNQIVQDIKRLKTIWTRAAEVSSSIKEMETSLAEDITPDHIGATMDRRPVGLKKIRSPRQYLSVVFFWLVIPCSFKLVGYSWPIKHLTENALYLTLIYVSLLIIYALITRNGLRLGSTPILLHRVAVCCSYALFGFPVDLVALLGELSAYLLVQLSPLIVFLATPLRFVHDLFHVELAPEELAAFAHVLLPEPTVAQMSALEALYREGLKLSEEEQKILNEEPNDVIKNVGLLTALRTASESDSSRIAPVQKARVNKRQRLEQPQKADVDGAAESPGPSPSVVIPASRLKGSSVRSGSVASVTAKDGKEAVIKTEDGVEGGKGTLPENRTKLTVGAEVAYQPSKEGDWIQCTIISVSGEGKKKRYEVQDPEPDERGAPGQIYKTSGDALIPISSPGAPLPDFPKGKGVLARYPETTTFYRAKVISMKKDVCRLNFEGEDEKDKETDVDRRYVLEVGNK